MAISPTLVIIENALTFAVSVCLSHGEPATLTGDRAKGRIVWHDGQGNHAIVVWSEKGLVALGFDHEGWSEEPSEKFNTPPPAELEALVNEACQVEGPRATCSMWATEAGSSVQALPISANPGAPKTDAGTVALDAILGREAPDDASLARRLARRRLDGPFDLTAEEADEILDVKRLLSAPQTASLLDEPYLARTATDLKRIGIHWKSPASRIREINATLKTARRSASAGRTALDSQILVGAATGDIAAVRAALDGGAAIECRSAPGEFGHVFSATPLQLAVHFHEDLVAELLLERGADPIGNPEVFNVLQIAVQRGYRRLCGALVRAGAPLTVDGCLANGDRVPGTALLNNASTLRDLAILALFVDGGSPVPRDDVRAQLLKVVETAGDSELAERVKVWRYDPSSHTSEVRMAIARRLAGDETPPSEKCEYPRPRRPFPSGLSESDRALFAAAAAGDLEAVKAAVANGARLDKPLWLRELPPWSEGATALLVALERNHFEVAEHLVRAGADVNAWIASPRETITPLYLAARGAQVELVRQMLSCGAKHPTPYLLHELCERSSLPQAPAVEFLEMVRLLLDTGASLPHDNWCLSISKLAEAAGAHDLVPRLVRSWAPDPVLEVPGPLDSAANVVEVSILLERAAMLITQDPALALTNLIEAWQRSLHPRIADAAEAVAHRVGGPVGQLEPLATFAARCAESLRPHNADGTPRTAPYATREASHVEIALQELEVARGGVPDPRAARLLLGWLWDGHAPPVDGTAMARCEDAVAALLVKLRDVRFVESLEQRCRLRRPLRLQPTRASLQSALRVMSDVSPGELSDRDRGNLSRVEDANASRRHVAKLPTVHDLYTAVFDAPDDDEPRRLLAERLLEVEDPHGEFIALQLARANASQVLGLTPNPEREAALVREYGARWLGALGAILKSDVVFERGFVAQATADGSDSQKVPGTGLGTQIEWSTLRRLSVRDFSERLLDGPRVRGLRELLDVRTTAFDALIRHTWPNLERLEQGCPRAPGSRTVHLEQIRDKTPSLRMLRLGLREGATNDVARLLDLWPHLRSLAVALRRPVFGELIALALERGLEDLTVLGFGPSPHAQGYVVPAADLRFRPHAAEIDISFPAELRAEFVTVAADWLRSMREVPIKSVVVRTPWGGKAKVPKQGAPSFSKARKTIELAPLFSAAEVLGLSCRVGEAEAPSFGDNPDRAA